jgi:glycosyltransferase involved in cell wall biosynthesis
MKKALFVLEDLNNTGSPLTVLHIIKSIPSNVKITILVLCGNDESDLSRKRLFEESGALLHVMNIPHLFGRKFKIFYHYYLLKIKKMIKKLSKNHHYDYFYLNRFNIAGPICSTIKRISKNSTIVFNSLGSIDSKSGNFYVNFLFNQSLRKTCDYCNYYISISDQCFTKKYPIKGKKVILHDYSDIEVKTSAKSFNSKGTFSLGQIGYFSDNKNQLFSLSLVKKLIDKGYKVSLRLIGFPTDMNYYSLMESFIYDNNLKNHVFMFDKNYDKISFFENIDLLLIPSKSEGFPLIIKESLSQKTPIFGSDAMPFEAKIEGVTILPLNEPDAWMKAIIEESYKKQLSSSDLMRDKEAFKNIVSRIFN